ncbi:MAG: ion channel [Saprospiraceae bacterium]
MANWKFKFSKTDPKTQDDLGFGNQITKEGTRLLQPDGSFNIKRVGFRVTNFYLELVELTWSSFFLILILSYILINSLYALLFVWIGIDQLYGIEKGAFSHEFMQAFFFSIQTFATVGYGAISPHGFQANLLSSFIAFTGVLMFALATGLFYARFSKPKSMIRFSDVAVLAPYQSGKAFMFRLVNTSKTKVSDLLCRVIFSWVDKDSPNTVRRYANVKLERDKVIFLPLNWTVVHPIDDQSPFYGLSMAELKVLDIEVFVVLSGFDQTFAQTVFANTSFNSDQILDNHKFKPMYHTDGGSTVLELDEISAVMMTEVIISNTDSQMEVPNIG